MFDVVCKYYYDWLLEMHPKQTFWESVSTLVSTKLSFVSFQKIDNHKIRVFL